MNMEPNEKREEIKGALEGLTRNELRRKSEFYSLLLYYLDEASVPPEL